jgi:hypothetical protein
VGEPIFNVPRLLTIPGQNLNISSPFIFIKLRALDWIQGPQFMFDFLQNNIAGRINNSLGSGRLFKLLQEKFHERR